MEKLKNTTKLNVHTKRPCSGRLFELCHTCKMKGHLMMVMATAAKTRDFRLPLWSRWDCILLGYYAV